MSWEDAWREGRTGWDAGAHAPPLLDYLAAREVCQGRALVPGCGSGYDAFALAEAGFTVRGLDIAPTATARFRALREARGLEAAQVEICNEDFFSLTPAEPYDLIWDYTFLCAIDPRRRDEWVEVMHRALADDGELVTLIFPVDPEDPSPSTHEDPGPPFRLHPEYVTRLVSGRFEAISITPAARSHEGRGGREFLARWRKKGA